MTNLVQFPGLGLSFELDRVAFSIGGADIYWYAKMETILIDFCRIPYSTFRFLAYHGIK